MALPALSSPEFMTEIPSTKQKIKFRPFLVKEEKILYMALEGQDPIEITNAIQNTLESCILTEGIDVAKLATFDIEHLFLQLRGKSVGEEVEIVLRHKEGDCKESVNLSINLDEIKVKGITHSIQTYQVVDTQENLSKKNNLLAEEYDGFSLSVDLNRSDKEQVVASLHKALDELQ